MADRVLTVENSMYNRKVSRSSSSPTDKSPTTEKPMTRNKGEKGKQEDEIITYADAVKKDIHVNNERSGLHEKRKLKLKST